MSGLIRKIDPPNAASLEAEQAVRQFFSEGLAAGEVVDVLEIADGTRPEISILSDDFLDTLHHRIRQDNLRRQLLEKLLNDEVQNVGRRNPLQAQLFGDKLRGVLSRYEKRLLTSAEVIEELIRLAKEMRDSRHRHEELGLSAEEAALYDALAGGVESGVVDARVAEITHELVKRIRDDLTVDWTSRESTQAALRRTIKRLLRRHGYTGPVTVAAERRGARVVQLDGLVDLIIDQARVMYATWPDTSPF
jgi:type I restriction enzyme R subunit